MFSAVLGFVKKICSFIFYTVVLFFGFLALYNFSKTKYFRRHVGSSVTRPLEYVRKKTDEFEITKPYVAPKKPPAVQVWSKKLLEWCAKRCENTTINILAISLVGCLGYIYFFRIRRRTV